MNVARKSWSAFAALVMLCRSTTALTPHRRRSCHALFLQELSSTTVFPLALHTNNDSLRVLRFRSVTWTIAARSRNSGLQSSVVLCYPQAETWTDPNLFRAVECSCACPPFQKIPRKYPVVRSKRACLSSSQAVPKRVEKPLKRPGASERVSHKGDDQVMSDEKAPRCLRLAADSRIVRWWY